MQLKGIKHFDFKKCFMPFTFKTNIYLNLGSFLLYLILCKKSLNFPIKIQSTPPLMALYIFEILFGFIKNHPIDIIYIEKWHSLRY